MKHVRFIEGFTETLTEGDRLNPIEMQAEKNLHKKTIHVVPELFDRQWIKALRKERKHKKYMDRIGMPNIQLILKR